MSPLTCSATSDKPWRRDDQSQVVQACIPLIRVAHRYIEQITKLLWGTWVGRKRYAAGKANVWLLITEAR